MTKLLLHYLDELKDDQSSFLGFDQICVNTRGSSGDTPLKFAVVRGEVEVVDEMLNAGADPNLQGEDGYTPLHHAYSQGQYAIADLLLKWGASDEITDLFERTPSDYDRRTVRRLLGKPNY